MLPGHLIGTIITERGSEPFVLRTPTGTVELGAFVAADPLQRSIGPAEREAVERQVRAAAGGEARSLRLGEYCCPQCGRWVDVVRRPQSWAGDRCRRC